MRAELIDWFVNTINYLIFSFIFIKAIDTPCFNSGDLTITLIGVSSSVFLFVIKLIKKIK